MLAHASDLSFNGFAMEDLVISNRANLILVAAFLILATFFPLPPGALTEHLLFGFGMLIFGVLAFKMRWMGGGVAKFNGAVALWFGPSEQYALFVMFACFGGYAVWRIASWIGRPDKGAPVNLVGVPVAGLLFLTTPMWVAIGAGWRHLI